ncbi:hypothetical protein MTR_5g030460 [Medicago truncatula]|uniref:Uncharacterized protein n=1 Tax=Medicago truncatula TaxID=3880 RepID=G7KF34_MEDTR|nr:hypothetical protein MTR_5g030460 [Medicago truncatula]
MGCKHAPELRVYEQCPDLDSLLLADVMGITTSKVEEDVICFGETEIADEEIGVGDEEEKNRSMKKVLFLNFKS